MYLANEFETKDIALIRFPCYAVSQNGLHTQFGIHGLGLQAARHLSAHWKERSLPR